MSYFKLIPGTFWEYFWFREEKVRSSRFWEASTAIVDINTYFLKTSNYYLDCVPHRRKRDRWTLRSPKLPYKRIKTYHWLSTIFLFGDAIFGEEHTNQITCHNHRISININFDDLCLVVFTWLSNPLLNILLIFFNRSGQ